MARQRKGISTKIKDELLVKAMHRCCLCPQHEDITEIHHIIPIREKGPNTEENLMVVCPTCHEKIHRIRKMYTPDQLKMYKEKWERLCAQKLPLEELIIKAPCIIIGDIKDSQVIIGDENIAFQKDKGVHSQMERSKRQHKEPKLTLKLGGWRIFLLLISLLCGVGLYCLSSKSPNKEEVKIQDREEALSKKTPQSSPPAPINRTKGAERPINLPTEPPIPKVKEGNSAEVLPEPTPPTSLSLVISSIPVGADVYLDGEYKGNTHQPKTIKPISLGEHKIMIRKEGYEDFFDVITIEKSQPVREYSARLTPKRE